MPSERFTLPLPAQISQRHLVAHMCHYKLLFYLSDTPKVTCTESMNTDQGDRVPCSLLIVGMETSTFRMGVGSPYPQHYAPPPHECTPINSCLPLHCCRCYNCGGLDHHAKECKLPPQPKKCHFCQSIEHMVANCPIKAQQSSPGSQGKPSSLKGEEEEHSHPVLPTETTD